MLIRRTAVLNDDRKPVRTLKDSDIITQRIVNRRSLLSATGLALGAAAVAAGMAAGSSPAHASSDKANTYDNDSGDRRPSTDND
jgi:nitrous oxide reductase